MVGASVPEVEAIQCAAVGAARLLEMGDELGAIQLGFVADLVAVNGNRWRIFH